MKLNSFWRILLSAVTLSAVTFHTASAQDAVIKKIIEEGTTNNQTMQHLDVLSNRFGGRLCGSDAFENALLWTASQFQKWGYEVTLEEAGQTSVGFNRGPWFGRIHGLSLPNGEGSTLHFATPSYTSGTKGVQKGHVLIEPKTEEEFNKMKGRLKGAWVLVSGMNDGLPITHSPADHQRRDSIIKVNAENAQFNKELIANYKKGAGKGKSDAQLQEELKGQLKPIGDEPALFYRQMEEAGVLGFIQSATVPIMVRADRYVALNPASNFENLPTLPDIKLDEHQFRFIYQMASERRSFELEFDIRNHFKPGPVKYHNVIAKLKGTKNPEKMVMISGHLDAYDVATGGVDCGVGVTPALESARLLSLAGAKPKQSIVFVLFAAEEFGLLGAKAWVKAHKDELDNVSNLFNRDGGPLCPTGISVPEAMYDDFVKASRHVEKINPDFKFTVKKVPARARPKKYGSNDASVFMLEGVPAIPFSLEDVKGYNFLYKEIWHTERDTYNMSIPEYQEHTAVLQAIIAYELANMDHTLSRKGLFK